MSIHPRQPYSGELVYTAFSGSHQDAISKGMKAMKVAGNTCWNVPYLPIDPRDVGCSYKAIVRINSQSGKGGVAYIMESDFGYEIPKWMQPSFGTVIQSQVDQNGREFLPKEIHELFHDEYIRLHEPYSMKKCTINWEDREPERDDEVSTTIHCVLDRHGREISFSAKGNGPVDAFVRGVRQHTGLDFSVDEYAEHAIGHSADSRAIAYIRIREAGGRDSIGAGIDSNISLASIKAVLSAVNRIENQVKR